MKSIKTLIKPGLLIGVLVFGALIFLPRKYKVPHFQNRPGTQYWNLPTGSRIGYTFIAGKGIKKPYPIIYLEGGPGGAIGNNTIEILAPLAENGYDVYLYDQVGSGHSERLKDIAEYTAKRHVKDLNAIIQKTGSAKAILIGQSWGAILAVLFLAQHTDKVAKIIFTGPGPIYPFNRATLTDLAPDSLHLKEPVFTNAMGNQKANNLRTKAMKFFAVRCGIKIASDSEADDFETYLGMENSKSVVADTSKHSRTTAGGGFYAEVMTFNSLLHVPDPRPVIKASPVPVLIMKGQYDNQKWGYTHEYMQLFSNHELVVIPGAGHAIYVEKPEIYLQTIRTFLNNN